MVKKSNKQKNNMKTRGKKKVYQSLESNDNSDTVKKSTCHKNGKQMKDDYTLRKSIIGEDGKRNIIEMPGDGNCLFRSLSDQLFHDYGNRYKQVRMDLCNFLEENEGEFGIFLLLDDDEEDVRDFRSYLSEMREDGTWGGDVEIACAARLYKRRITIFSVVGAITIGIGDDTPSGPDLLLSYHENSHYNSVQDESFCRSFRYNVNNVDLETKTGKDTSYNSPSKQIKDVIQNNQPCQKTSNKESCSILEHKPKQKRNDLCNCGSGLRYKKCCLVTSREQVRLAKWREKHGLGVSEDSNRNDVNNENKAMLEGGFCVMNI